MNRRAHQGPVLAALAFVGAVGAAEGVEGTSFDRHLDAVEQALQVERYTEALRELDAARRLVGAETGSRRSTRLHLVEARLDLALGLGDAAVDALQRHLADPGSAPADGSEARLLLARALLATGQPDAALVQLLIVDQEGARLDERQAIAVETLRVAAALERGDLDVADREAGLLLRRLKSPRARAAPDEPLAREAIGAVRLAQRRYAEAVECLGGSGGEGGMAPATVEGERLLAQAFARHGRLIDAMHAQGRYLMRAAAEMRATFDARAAQVARLRRPDQVAIEVSIAWFLVVFVVSLVASALIVRRLVRGEAARPGASAGRDG